MSRLHRFLRILMFTAACCLVANDIVRLASLDAKTGTYFWLSDTAPEDANKTAASASPWAEEEAEHKLFAPVYRIVLLPGRQLDAASAHLIQDDKVRHLAYLPVFSPPPDRV